MGSGYQWVCSISILRGGSREVQMGGNFRVSTFPPVLRSGFGASLGKGTLEGSSQWHAGAYEATYLSACSGKGWGRDAEPKG